MVATTFQDVAALAVALSDLKVVQLLRDAIRTADLSGGKVCCDGAVARRLDDCYEARRHIHPEPKYENRVVYHPTPRYLPRPVICPTRAWKRATRPPRRCPFPSAGVPPRHAPAAALANASVENSDSSRARSKGLSTARRCPEQRVVAGLFPVKPAARGRNTGTTFGKPLQGPNVLLVRGVRDASAQQVEELVELVSVMDRDTLIQQFQTYRASFPVDFTREYLESQDLEQLRHLFLAMCLQTQRMPDVAA